MDSIVGLGFNWKMVVGSVVVALLAATACSVEDVTLDLDGDDTIPADETAYYLAELWGGTPHLGFVYWFPYVDLDGDNWPDTNERLYDYTVYSEVDRLGNADLIFSINPEEFFGERDLDVPDEMKVGIRAELYWSDPIEPRVTKRDSMETTITSSTSDS